MSPIDYKGNLILLKRGVKVLEIAVGAVLVPTRFSLVRISIRHLRNSGVGGSKFDPQIALYSPPVLGLLSWLKAQESALQLCESHSHIAHIKVCSNLVV